MAGRRRICQPLRFTWHRCNSVARLYGLVDRYLWFWHEAQTCCGGGAGAVGPDCVRLGSGNSSCLLDFSSAGAVQLR